jgi:hypothetical protein
MSSFSRLAVMLAAVAILSACEPVDRYPVSGQECGPGDPVRTIDASVASCLPSSF